jgi:Tol biopolymer transport system component
MYWAWSPDGHTILLHVGESSLGSQNAQLSLIQNGQQPQKISDSPAAFQAPQFSPDGKAILYASTKDANQDALFLASAQGGNPNAIATYTGAIAFSWSPDGAKIASLVTPEDADLPVQGPIFVSDAGGQNRKPVTTEDAIAFYWSPDSKQIAYLTLLEPGQSSSSATDYLRVAMQRLTRAGRAARSGGLSAPLPQTAEIQMRWHIVNLAEGGVRTLATFSPTDHFISLLPFFDQYARSITFWSPDSQHLVYTQQEGQDAGSIWVVDTAQGSTPRRIGDGTLAVWSWK